MRLRQIAYLSQALVQPGGIRAFISWKPFSITSFRTLRSLKRAGLDFRTIIDGGANQGQFARAATETYPEADVISFEPLPDIAERLRRNLADRPQVQIIQSALGNRTGTTEFYRHPYSLSSSILRPLNGAGTVEAQRLEVPICRLDEALADALLLPPVLLKLDLQGYELEALRGAADLLKRVSHVLLETSFEASYAEEPLFGALLTHMAEAGFGFVRPVDVLRDEGGAIVQMDALFVRAHV